MLRMEMLPANQGDCLWIEYGQKNKPRLILIDGGTAGSIKALVEKVKALPAKSRHLELLVVTHVDADHIAGVLKFLETPQLGLSVGEVWFNAYKHLLEKGETFGPAQGEKLSADIVAGRFPWNRKFKGQAVKVPDKGPLPVKKLDGDLEFVILGPTMEKLRILKPVWVEACKEARIKPGKPVNRPRPAGLEAFGPIDVRYTCGDQIRGGSHRGEREQHHPAPALRREDRPPRGRRPSGGDRGRPQTPVAQRAPRAQRLQGCAPRQPEQREPFSIGPHQVLAIPFLLERRDLSPPEP